MQKEVFTTYQVAGYCQVHHTTVINWIERKLLKGYVTPGGHRRIPRDDLISFMQHYQIPIPEELSGKTSESKGNEKEKNIHS